MQWFLSKDNGAYTINYALKRHYELAEDVVTCIGAFTSGSELMPDVYLKMFNAYYSELVDYFQALTTCFPYLAIKYPDTLHKTNFLNAMVDRALSCSGQTGMESPQVVIAALALLCEIWGTFQSSFQDHSERYNQMMQAFQRNSRDKEKSVRIVAVASMFKLLDKFSADKYAAAPALYKQLIFSLVENPHE